MQNDFSDLDGIAQASLVKKGEVSPKELIEAAINRIEAINPEINFLVNDDFDRALQRADSIDKSAVFSGVPFLIKDLIPYAGMPFTLGSRFFSRPIARDVTPYANSIDKAGLITLGKTATSEFALLGSTETFLLGNTLNPWNREYSAAGSSGGSAAAVASRIVPLAHASDGGGSIRIPASVCGLFGFKPSVKRTVPAILFENDFTNLVSDHCVSISVRDSAAFLAATERKDQQAVLPPLGYIDRPIRQSLKIAVYNTILIGDLPEPEVLKALEHTARLCEQLGHEVIEVKAPKLDGKAISDAFFILAGSAVDGVAGIIESIKGSYNDNDIEPFTQSLIEWYRTLPAESLAKAQKVLEYSKRIMSQYVDQFDVVLCPTLGTLPQPLGYLSPRLDREELIRRTEKFAGFTPIHNITGLPAMSVPLCMTESGLPVGSHFTASIGDEAILLGLAYQLEEASPWADKKPPLAAIKILRDKTLKECSLNL